MISTITAYLNSITHAISNPSKALSSIATRLNSAVREFFLTQEDRQIENCEECKTKHPELKYTHLSPSYLGTYQDISHFPLENFVAPGFFIRIHEDQRVCFFSLESTEQVFFRIRNDVGKIIVQNDGSSTETIKIPETLNHKGQTFEATPGCNTFQAFCFYCCVFFFSIFSLDAHEPYSETLHSHWTQSFEVSEVLYQEQSDFWDLILFENSHFGKILAIDGVIQLTEADEPFYSEMMAHVPLLTHGDASSVLIIGGGDGCILREVLKHPVKEVTLVEIDRKVIAIAQNYFAKQLDGAFDDPRVEIVIQDASEYVKTAPHSFDVIICDSTDPVGPARVLFSKEFYADCKTLLNCGGIFVNQNGAPFVQKEELDESLENRKDLFRVATFYTTVVPTYIGGFMTLGWSSDEEYEISQEVLEERFEFLKGKTRYYNPAIHQAAFALPEYIQR